jgi:catechol 2,3-dioxygenase-like lactoylglutathione lyase family enzyme
MIDHVYISVTNIEKSLAFYREALKPLGWAEFAHYEAASGPDNVPDLYGLGDAAYVSRTGVGSSIWLRQRKPGETGLYLGIVCDTNDDVDAAYAAAISAGGSDEGQTSRPHILRPWLLRRKRRRLRRQPPRVRAQSLEPVALDPTIVNRRVD